MQYTFVPTEQKEPTLDFKTGNPEYDKAFRLWRLIEVLSKGVYGGQYQDFNVFYAFIFENLNRTIWEQNEVERRSFLEETKGFNPPEVEVLSGYKYNEETEQDDIPVYEMRKDWEALLMEYTLGAQGWAYVPNKPVVPFVLGEAATYHMAKLEEALLSNHEAALTLVTELDIKFE